MNISSISAHIYPIQSQYGPSEKGLRSTAESLPSVVSRDVQPQVAWDATAQKELSDTLAKMFQMLKNALEQLTQRLGEKVLPHHPEQDVDLSVPDVAPAPVNTQTQVPQVSVAKLTAAGIKNDDPLLSSKRNGEKPYDVFMGLYTTRPFWGEREIAPTVDAFKLLMMKYGQSPSDIFQNLQTSGDGYDITFRDGFELHISREELALAAKHTRFVGNDSGMIKDANFLYGAYIKRQQLEKAGDYKMQGTSFTAALLLNLRIRTSKNVLEGMGMASNMHYVMAGHTKNPVALAESTAGGFSIDGKVAKEGHYGYSDDIAQTWGYELV